MRLKVIFKHCEVARVFLEETIIPLFETQDVYLVCNLKGIKKKSQENHYHHHWYVFLFTICFCFDFSSHSYYFKSCVIFLLLTIWRCVQNTLFFLKNKQGKRTQIKVM